MNTAHYGLGGFNIMRYGAGPNGPMRTLGQYMLGSGATFGYVSRRYMIPYPGWRLAVDIRPGSSCLSEA